MRPFEQRQEDALRVPITMVSVSMLAIGVALLAMLAFAVVMLNSEGATKAPGRAILGYTLPLCALIVIAITFHVRRLLSALEIAQRELCEREADARFLATHHAVSRLPNRRLFTQALRDRLAVAPRICLVLIRLDSFSTLMEKEGRRAAEALAAQIGPRLMAGSHPDDLVAQLANDLFAVAHALLPEEDGETLRRQACAALDLPFDLAGNPVRLFASAGVTVAEAVIDPEQLLADAERDLARISADWTNRDRRQRLG